MPFIHSRSQLFVTLEATTHLPFHLRDELPEILWLPSVQVETSTTNERTVALWGKVAGDSEGKPCCLISIEPNGKPMLHFPLAETIEGILLEKYREEFQPTLEMKLPFNYSRLPNWVKGLGRNLRKGQISNTPEILFPPGGPSLVVEWLRALAEWAEYQADGSVLIQSWPEGYKAAATISHDVDTDWIFNHPDWLDSICDLEEKHGFYGVWFCVPWYCRSRMAERGIRRLIERGCEIGCHGYNHDAKLPFVSPHQLEKRLNVIREFVNHWSIRGFRSEWLWRTSSFYKKLAPIFAYDSSVPNVDLSYTQYTGNGCSTCFPYKTYSGLIELPLTLPMDEERIIEGLEPMPFWQKQVEKTRLIIDKGGMVMFSLHPQPHQAANKATLKAIDFALSQLAQARKLWITRPDKIVDWIIKGKHE